MTAAGYAPRGDIERWALTAARTIGGLPYAWSSAGLPGSSSSRFNAVERLLARGLLAFDDRRHCYRSYTIAPGRYIPPPPRAPSWPGRKIIKESRVLS